MWKRSCKLHEAVALLTEQKLQLTLEIVIVQRMTEVMSISLEEAKRKQSTSAQ